MSNPEPSQEVLLNDFAVIRTTFETIEVFRDDEYLQREMLELITNSRRNLVRGLSALGDIDFSDHTGLQGTEPEYF